MQDLKNTLRDLVIANRILAREGVVDAFGHISVRNPNNPERYFLSISRAPELITIDDIVEFTLDGEATELNGRTPYGERAIHGAVYERRPDVHSVVHNHSQELIPFTITNIPLRALAHVFSGIGAHIPKWDIRDKFGATDHLVVTMEQGRDLAETLDDNSVGLMCRHGSVIASNNIKEAVMIAVYLQVNAKLQLQTMQLGEFDYLTPEEVELCFARQSSPLGLDRAWEYWVLRAGCGDM